MENYDDLREYHLNRGKTFSDEFYKEAWEWNQKRKEAEREEMLKKTVITPDKVNAYGQKRKPNGRWNYDYLD